MSCGSLELLTWRAGSSRACTDSSCLRERHMMGGRVIGFGLCALLARLVCCGMTLCMTPSFLTSEAVLALSELVVDR